MVSGITQASKCSVNTGLQGANIEDYVVYQCRLGLGVRVWHPQIITDQRQKDCYVGLGFLLRQH